MLRFLALFSILLAGACSSCASISTRPVEYATTAAAIRDHASVRIVAECPDGRVKWGSGVAVSQRHILTAAHVTECESSEAFSFTIIMYDGTTVHMLLDERAGGNVDTALLVVDGMSAPFKTFARVGAPPKRDDRLCYTGGDYIDIRLSHCGPYAAFKLQGEWLDVVATHGAPGNSGAGVFNEWGELVGILYAGSFKEGRDHWICFEAARKWRHLIP